MGSDEISNERVVTRACKPQQGGKKPRDVNKVDLTESNDSDNGENELPLYHLRAGASKPPLGDTVTIEGRPYPHGGGHRSWTGKPRC